MDLNCFVVCQSQSRVVVFRDLFLMFAVCNSSNCTPSISLREFTFFKPLLPLSMTFLLIAGVLLISSPVTIILFAEG